jgi:DNA-binding GntR family transcriptional regulator
MAPTDRSLIEQPADVKSTEALAERVVRQLREEIVGGQIAPNERIKQSAVAERLEVSRLPVREALRQLEMEGLVSLERDVGARVTPLDPQALIEIYLVREALEPILTSHAATRLGPEEVERLREVNEAGEKAAEVEDHSAYLVADRQFHGAIFDAAGLPTINGVIRGMLQNADRYRRAYSLLPHRLETSVVEHRMILESIGRGAAEDAGELHRIHIRRTRLTLSQHPELFAGEAADE